MKICGKIFIASSMVLVAIIVASTGCKIESGDEVRRDVSIDVTGFYTGVNGGSLIARVSGASVESIDLRQSGDLIEGYDNNGRIFRGRIGSVSDSRASITLEGTTTQGVDGVISGYIDVSGSEATMTGTWFEDTLTSRVNGRADVAEPSETLSISPSSATLNNNGDNQTFTASGGDGTYNWTLSNSNLGRITGSGSSVQYTRTAVGNNTITVRSNSESVTANIQQPQ